MATIPKKFTDRYQLLNAAYRVTPKQDPLDRVEVEIGDEKDPLNFQPQAKIKRWDLTGKKFGRWTVIKQAGKKHGQVAWLCKCDCGTEKIHAAGNLKQKRGTKSCGQVGGKLHAHHVKSFSEYPELRTSINNGKTLCVDCHRQTDSYGGRRIYGSC